jgi:ABC-type methionine transport system ATPase subunit
MRLLFDINRTRKTAILMVTHNMNIVREYPGRILVCTDNECKEISTDNSLV